MSAIPIGIPGWPELAFCTASMASARSALASSCRVAMCGSCRLGEIFPARAKRDHKTIISPRGLRPRLEHSKRGTRARLLPSRELDAELLQLAVQVCAFEAYALCHPAHVPRFAADVIIEVHPLEGIARLTQRQIER